MPYNRQGIARAENCLRINMKNFTKQGIFKQSRNMLLTLNNKVGIAVILNEDRKYLFIKYTLTNNTTLEKTDYEYKVYIAERVSNLGIGKVYYFECPFNKRLCRVLYMTYGSTMFKSRFAYSQRIYYNLQTYSKQAYALNRSIKLKKILDKMNNSGIRTKYKGKETKTYKRLIKIRDDYYKFELLNWNIISNNLMKLKTRYKL